MSETPHVENSTGDALVRERYELLRRVQDWLETPMLVLAFAG